MGVFAHILAAPKATEAQMTDLLLAIDPHDTALWNLEVSSCRVWQCPGGAAAWLSEHCCGYEEMAQQLSALFHGPLMLCYIYDDDVWGYYFYDSGRAVDCFCPAPDFLEEVSPQERRRLAGQASVVAPYFSVEPQSIAPYLLAWEEGWQDEGEDAWQMADFLQTLGFPLAEEDEDAPDGPVPSLTDFFQQPVGQEFLALYQAEPDTPLLEWLNYFASPAFLSAALQPDFWCGLAYSLTSPIPDPLCIALSIVYPPDQTAVLRKVLPEQKLHKPDDEENVFRASFQEYFILVGLAQKNSAEQWDTESTCTFSDILQYYREDYIPEKYTRRKQIQRHPLGLKLLCFFVQQFPLPKSLSLLLWNTLDLRSAQYGRSARLYGPLREQLLSTLPQLGQTSSRSFDAARVELLRCLAGVYRFSGESAEEAAQKATDALFARSDFSQALWDDTFILETLVLKDPMMRTDHNAPFLQRMCDFYQSNPDAPHAKELLPRFQKQLHALRVEERKKEELLQQIPAQVPGLTHAPFFFYWLNALSGTMDLPQLYSMLRLHFEFEPDWSVRFIGTEKDGTPSFKSLRFTWNKQRIQVRFHLHYIDFLVDGKPVYQPCFSLEQLFALKNAERFFYLLPLALPTEQAPGLLEEKIAHRLSKATPFLDEFEIKELSQLLSQHLYCPPDKYVLQNARIDWIFALAEEDDSVDDEQLNVDFEEKYEEIFEPEEMSQTLCAAEELYTQEPIPLHQWLLDTLRQRAAWEAEQLEQGLSLKPVPVPPEHIFWETADQLFRYTCVEAYGQLFPDLFSQDPKTGSFRSVGSAQQFLSQAVADLPASEQLRQELRHKALGFSKSMKQSSYVSNLARLPQTVYIKPDLSKADLFPDQPFSELPAKLTMGSITLKSLEQLLHLFAEGALLRLELDWETMYGSIDAVMVGAPCCSVVLLRDEKKWACLSFNDQQNSAMLLIADPRTYLGLDYKSIEQIPFAYGTLPSYAIFSGPDPLMKNLSLVFKQISHGSLSDLYNSSLWGYLNNSVYYSKEKFILDKRTLGVFPAQRACNQLTDRFYLKTYPTQLDAVGTDNTLQTMRISGGNRDMPRFYLNRFFQGGLQKLIFHFGEDKHLVLFWRKNCGLLLVLNDITQQAHFAFTTDNDTAETASSTSPVQEDGIPTALAFRYFLSLRSASDLLFACWESLDKLLADTTQYLCWTDSPYDELRQKALQTP